MLIPILHRHDLLYSCIPPLRLALYPRLCFKRQEFLRRGVFGAAYAQSIPQRPRTQLLFIEWVNNRCFDLGRGRRPRCRATLCLDMRCRIRCASPLRGKSYFGIPYPPFSIDKHEVRCIPWCVRNWMPDGLLSHTNFFRFVF